MTRLEGMCVLALIVYGRTVGCTPGVCREVLVEEYGEAPEPNFVVFACKCKNITFKLVYQ